MYKVIITAKEVEFSTSCFHSFQEAYDKFFELYKAFKNTAKEVETEESKQERTFYVYDKEGNVSFTVWLKHPKRKVL